MTEHNKVIRFIVYVLGLCILSLGVVLNTKTGLGVSAINSLPYFISETTFISLGTATIILYIVFILIQILVYKKITTTIILQLPVTFFFGRVTDYFNNLIQISEMTLIKSIVVLILAILLTALGLVLSVHMKIVPNAADGVVMALSEKFAIDFGKMKYRFDILMVLITSIISFLILKTIIGIGFGTVASAILIGQCARVYIKVFGFYKKEEPKTALAETGQ